ncbi:putative NRPS-like enzyme [Aspergillus clavatus NRRL 1]|uniref:Carrier domain-containing protein n=1 Tax=Aspergillus clavatus (strain ATCC 1007 / CBS 513.65 / DSM 816 / NCTC 3887 / NRRL 1 / QM 1276 / 107) TaxID=344612 RepID=A1C8R8_ASPCL|nr:uncharacterized protein ACLA_044250 [Aspergillus clavatus NRRL 1]EAW13705.1 hypothetical protein ACLA_044250 [Aspergillus clavatus NRRL 1]
MSSQAFSLTLNPLGTYQGIHPSAAISAVSHRVSAVKLAPKLSQDGYVQIHKTIYKGNGAIWSIAEGSYMDAPVVWTTLSKGATLVIASPSHFLEVPFGELIPGVKVVLVDEENEGVQLWRGPDLRTCRPQVDVEELRKFMQSRADPFVMPDMIFAMDSFPLNVNSKTDRLALQAQLDGKLAQDDDPHEGASLLETNSLTAYDALRLAFPRCLQNRFRNMDRSSSFTRLGGNSWAAIQVSNFLEQPGYSIPAAQVLKLDTIERLEDRLRSQSNVEVAEEGGRSLQATATPVQRLFHTRSLWKSNKDRQKHYYTLSWYITQRGEHVATDFEVQLEKVYLYRFTPLQNTANISIELVHCDKCR